MMHWYGSWAWLLMIPMLFAMWALIALVVLPWLRPGRGTPRSPIDRLDDRLAAGEIGVQEYRSLRDEIEHRSPV